MPDDIRSRFIRNEASIIEPGPMLDAMCQTREIPGARRSSYRRVLPDMPHPRPGISIAAASAR